MDIQSESDPLYRRPPVEAWRTHYATPILGFATGLTFGFCTASYIYDQMLNYRYPNNPVNPEIMANTLTAMKVTAITAGSLVGSSLLQTGLRVIYNCTTDLWFDSFTGPLAHPQTIVKNTAAALVAGTIIGAGFTREIFSTLCLTGYAYSYMRGAGWFAG